MSLNKFSILEFISQLVKLGPRQGKNEQKTAEFIISILKRHKIPFYVQNFTTQLPEIKKAVLIADGKRIQCEASCYISGEIANKEHIISSLTSSQPFLYQSNINFNPECSGISLSNFYFAPSLAISREDLMKVVKASRIRGVVKVKRKKHKSANILTGNKKNPEFILFAHYDSLKKGATDNASGTGVLMELLLKYPQTLKKCLFVFSGNEELSYDQPVYWGHGFRVFEKRYFSLLQKSKKIIVVDCVGNGKTNFSQDKHFLFLAFPIKNFQKIQKKAYALYGDIKKLMKVYHSDLDDINQLKKRYLEEAKKQLLQEILRQK